MTTAGGAAARCRHFGACGGCAVQDVPYPEQLEAKSLRLAALLAPHWAGPVPVHPSPDLWFYRNKMEFSFGRVVTKEADGTVRIGATVLGQKEKGRWYRTLDLQECFLLSPEAPGLLAAVREWALARGLEGFDQKSGRGQLRHLLVREAKGGAAGGRLVMLLTAPLSAELPAASFVAAVRGAYPASTILHGVNRLPSDVARSEEAVALSGPGWIEETLVVPGARRLRFRLSPFSFFQTNTRGAERLYGLVRSWAAEASGPGDWLDLYGGAGGIAFSVADLAPRVACVESNPAATEDGRHNADLNGIANVDFVTAPVEAFLASRSGDPCGAVILDPPRCGVHPKALRALNALETPCLVYVSCNPEALVRDLGALAASWGVERLEAVDLFPHTGHVETVALLRRRKGAAPPAEGGRAASSRPLRSPPPGAA